MNGGGFIPEEEGGRISGSNSHVQPTQLQRSDLRPPAPSSGPSHHYDRSNHSSGCTRCNSLSFSDEFYKAFGVLLCNQCRRSEQLLSKSSAKQRYQLTDGDLSKLGSVRRTNPHRKDWQPMQLYLESQIREIAHAKHGGEEGLEERARAILDKKLQDRVKKRQGDKDREQRDAARLESIKRKIATNIGEVSGAAVDEDEVEDI